jgi:di/tripeptidase
MTKTAVKENSSQVRATTPATEAEALQNVRELLFGDASREQSDRLASIQEQVDEEMRVLRADYDAQIEAIHAQMKREVESLRWQIGDLAKAKVERQDLGALLSEVAERLA